MDVSVNVTEQGLVRVWPFKYWLQQQQWDKAGPYTADQQASLLLFN